MKRAPITVLAGLLTLSLGSIAQEDDPSVNSAPAFKALSGMSILGNNEAPKSLVIVPWKSSELGDELGMRNLLDERASPVDRDVFMRELDFYEIRTGTEAYSSENLNH
jgi:hypothetical protein